MSDFNRKRLGSSQTRGRLWIWWCQGRCQTALSPAMLACSFPALTDEVWGLRVSVTPVWKLGTVFKSTSFYLPCVLTISCDCAILFSLVKNKNKILVLCAVAVLNFSVNHESIWEQQKVPIAKHCLIPFHHKDTKQAGYLWCRLRTGWLSWCRSFKIYGSSL